MTVTPNQSKRRGFCVLIPNSNSFADFSHSKGFGAELFSYSGSLGLARVIPKVLSVEGSTNVPPRFHQGFPEVLQRLRKFCGARSVLGCQKVLRKVPHHFFPSSTTRFCIFPNSVSIAARVKSLGQNDTFVFCGSLQQMVFAPKNVLWSVPQKVFYIALTVSYGFLANTCCCRKGSVEVPPTIPYICLPNGCCLIKRSLERSANCASRLSPSFLLGSKLRELFTCLLQTNPVSRKRPIISLLLGYSLGFFFTTDIFSKIANSHHTV